MHIYLVTIQFAKIHGKHFVQITYQSVEMSFALAMHETHISIAVETISNCMGRYRDRLSGHTLFCWVGWGGVVIGTRS